MIILAAAVMISLSNTGIIDKANHAVNANNLKEIEHIATLAWSEAYTNGARTEAELKAAVDTALKDVDISKYDIETTEKGVIVTVKQGEIAPGLYESGSNYTVLKTSWEDLIANEVIHVTDGGAVYTKLDMNTGVNSSSDFLVGDLVIPYGITALGDADVDTGAGNMAFAMCTELTGISIPDSVTTIAVGAFAACISLESVIIPDSVTTIGASAFQACGNLKSITFGKNSKLSSIGMIAFESCSSLESIDIVNGITNIEPYTFRYCTNLASVNIPASVTVIDYQSFLSCKNLNTITFEGTVEQWNASSFDFASNNWDVPATYVQCTNGTVEL